MTENISYAVAFIAGLLTFFSPCLLPLIPSFIAYIAGVSLGDLKDSGKSGSIRGKTALHSLLFILGFSIVFILLGLTATFIGKTLYKYQAFIRIAGGLFIVLFGLYLTGLIKLDLLLKERRFQVPMKGASYAGSFIMGVTFAAAWTPCAGPILGSILVLAGTKANIAEGAKLLTIYSAGIGVPFFITGIAVNTFTRYFNRFKKTMSIINIVSGIFLVIVGLLVAAGYLSQVSERLMGLFVK